MVGILVSFWVSAYFQGLLLLVLGRVIIHFNGVFHYKPSILGYPYFWKHPHVSSLNFFCSLQDRSLSLRILEFLDIDPWIQRENIHDVENTPEI